MEKPIAAIEFGSKKLKLVIGYELEGKVYPVYACTKNYGHAIENGRIDDKEAVRFAVQSIKDFTDQEMKIKITIDECLLSLPPIGLYVYTSRQVTGIVNNMLGDDKKISALDIKNLLTLTKNSIDQVDNKLVDIIPNNYILDNSVSYNYAPVGVESSYLTMLAKVHTLPKEVESEYKEAITCNDIAIKRTIVAPNAATYLLATEPDLPKDYILVDIGSNLTTVSLIGRTELYSSLHINWGGDKITDRLITTFNINYNDADKLKKSYGVNAKLHSYKTGFFSEADENGNSNKYSPEEVEMIIEKEVTDFVQTLNGVIEILLKEYDDSFNDLPIILIGGGSQLRGLGPFLASKTKAERVYVYKPHVIGARDATYTNCLGMILESVYTPSLNEDAHGPAGRLTREE